MTTIAWDGRTLAADRQATIGTLKRTTRKIWCVCDKLVAFVGDSDQVLELLHWMRRGAGPTDFPEHQRRGDSDNRIVVITSDRRIQVYERTPFPIEFGDKHFAMGSGRDFALGAMAMGATAREALQVASNLDCGTGMGIDWVDLDLRSHVGVPEFEP